MGTTFRFALLIDHGGQYFHADKKEVGKGNVVVPARVFSYSGKVKMTKQEIIEMIQRAGFEAVERDTVYNRLESVKA